MRMSLAHSPSSVRRAVGVRYPNCCRTSIFSWKRCQRLVLKSLDRFDVSMLFLPKFGGEGIVPLTGGTRRTGWTGKVAQGLHDGVRNRFIVLRNQDGKLRQPAGQLFQVME